MYEIIVADSVLLFLDENKIKTQSKLKHIFHLLQDNSRMYKVLYTKENVRVFSIDYLTFEYVIDDEQNSIFIMGVTFTKSSLKIKI